MEVAYDSSDEGVLSRLYDKVFAQYWSFFWNHCSYEEFEPFDNEVEEAQALWGDYIKSQGGQCQGAVSVEEHTYLSGITSQTAKERSLKLEFLAKMQHALQLLVVGCDVLDLIPRPEDIDDIHTENIKYMYLPFMAGHVMMEKPELVNRMNVLRKSTVYLNQYMHMTFNLKILRESEATYWERKSDYSMQEMRNYKVTSAKFSITAKKSLTALFASAKDIESYLKNLKDAILQDEDMCRSMLLDICRLFSVEAINMLDMIKLELPMLKRRESEHRQRASDVKREQHMVTNADHKPWFVKIDDPYNLDPTTAHMLYKSMVFLPGHRLPKISLDECARIEMEMDVNTIGVKGRTNKGHDRIRRVPDIEESSCSESSASDSDGDSDDAKEKARWDDWKDEHPRGSGNKNRNVG